MVVYAITTASRVTGAGLQGLVFWVYGAIVSASLIVALGTGRSLPPRRRLLLIIVVAVLPVALAVSSNTSWTSAHVADLLIPSLWVLAYRARRSDRLWLAGALIGASAAFELWGALGVVAVLGRQPLRSYGRLAGGAVTVIATAYAPFALVGGFRMFSFRWSVSGGTLVGLLVGGNAPYPWTLRVVQAVAAVGAGWFVTRSIAPGRESWWLALLACLEVRMLLDPLESLYYWTPIRLLLVIGLGAAVTRNLRSAILPALLLLATIAPFAQGGEPGVVVVMLALTGLAVHEAEPAGEDHPSNSGTSSCALIGRPASAHPQG
jgi:hypothetical protein